MPRLHFYEDSFCRTFASSLPQRQFPGPSSPRWSSKIKSLPTWEESWSACFEQLQSLKKSQSTNDKLRVDVRVRWIFSSNPFSFAIFSATLPPDTGDELSSFYADTSSWQHASFSKSFSELELPRWSFRTSGSKSLDTTAFAPAQTSSFATSSIDSSSASSVKRQSNRDSFEIEAQELQSESPWVSPFTFQP